MKKLNIVKQDIKVQVELSIEELGTIAALFGTSTSESRAKANSHGLFKIIDDSDDMKFYNSITQIYKEAVK